MKKAIGIIPARFGSVRFPGKPLALLWEKPLIEHTYRAASAANLLDKVIVATDNERIHNVVVNFGGESILTGTCTSGTDRVVEAINRLQLNCDVVVNIQGDEPRINPVDIDLCVQSLFDDPDAMVGTIATPITEEHEALSTNIVKCVTDSNRNALYFSRALIPHSKTGKFCQATPYLRHVGLYAFQFNFLTNIFPHLKQGKDLEVIEDLEQLRILQAGHRIKVTTVSKTFPGVDTPEDLEIIKKAFMQDTKF